MFGLIRAAWDEPRAPNPPPRVWRDWVLVGVIAPAALLEGFLRPELHWRVVSVILVAGLVPTLLWRRTRPLLMIVITFAATGVLSLLTAGQAPELSALAYVLFLVYAVVRWGSGREMAIGLLIVFSKAGSLLVVNYTGLTDVIGACAVLFSAIALGAAFRYRARARMRELDQVKLLEREQLARDLHDTVAHHVSAMAIRAQAGLATAASRPEAAIDALRLIEAEAARALDEMRTMVRVLRRNQAADLTPARGIADLEQLVSPNRTGPSVHVAVSGDVDGIPPSVQAAIYRLAQESVTNARRHARHATRIEIAVAADNASVRLRVSDNGDNGVIRPAASPGYGLIGMIERATLLGGTCVAGPGPDRGWIVTAVLPLTGSAV